MSVCVSVPPLVCAALAAVLLLLLEPLSESGSVCRDSELTQMFPDVILPVGSALLAPDLGWEGKIIIIYSLVEKHFSRKEAFVWA